MDQSTYEVRLASWTEIISQCQARPDGMTARQWLADNNISEKRYYYWLRRVRLNALGKQPESMLVPATAVPDKEPMPIQLAEIPVSHVCEPDDQPVVVIRTKRATIEIGAGIPDELAAKLMKAVSHAL